MAGVRAALIRTAALLFVLAAPGRDSAAAAPRAGASSAPLGAPSPVAGLPDRAGAVFSSAHVTLRSADAVGRERADGVLRALEEGRAQILSDLRLTAAAPVEALLLSRAAFRALTGNPPAVRGAFDGRILLPAGPGEEALSADELRPVLLHELTHALVRGAVPATLPPWFEEGLAERFEGNTPAAAAAWLRDRRAPRFEGLDRIDRAVRAGGWREDAGHQGARLAIQALEDLAGADAAARILALVRDGETFDKALERVVPGGREALEARLAAHGANDR